MSNKVYSRRSKPERIEAKPLRHPGRWVLAAILVALVAWFIIGAARNDAYGWDTYFQYLFDTRIAIAGPVSYTHLTLPTKA